MSRRAFTLIELLAVVAIVALLMAILIPGLRAAREQARAQVCRVNLGTVSRGFLMYAQDWLDALPGGKHDYYDTDAGDRVRLDWLGVGSTKEWQRAPQEGTVYPYVGDPRPYVCPTHASRHEARKAEDWTLEHRSSYTAPNLLSGAPTTLLTAVWYPDESPGWDVIPQRDTTVNRMMPLLLVEEDTNWYLMSSKDSAWVTVDQVSERHPGGQGGIGYVDGHAELRRITRHPSRQKGVITAWNMLYELADGRLVAVGHDRMESGERIRFGWLRRAVADR